MVSSRGGKFGFVYKDRQKVYRALRREGHSVNESVRIANGGHTRVQRSAMAHKAAITRKRRGK